MHQILPAALKYSSDLAEAINRKRAAANLSASAETALVSNLSECCDKLYDKTDALSDLLKSVPTGSNDAITYYSSVIVPAMQQIRKEADYLESMTAKSYWPYPTYSDILYY